MPFLLSDGLSRFQDLQSWPHRVLTARSLVSPSNTIQALSKHMDPALCVLTLCAPLPLPPGSMIDTQYPCTHSPCPTFLLSLAKDFHIKTESSCKQRPKLNGGRSAAEQKQLIKTVHIKVKLLPEKANIAHNWLGDEQRKVLGWVDHHRSELLKS